MSNKIRRNILRGGKLEDECYKANTTTHERGMKDNRIFCYGLIDPMYDELLPMCKKCKANVIHEEETWEKPKPYVIGIDFASGSDHVAERE